MKESIQKRLDDVGKLILRLSVGGLMLFHGVGKIRGGVGGIATMVEDAGLPGFLAYGVYLGEVVAPILIVVGFLTRISALVLALNMVVAIGLAHANDLLALSDHGGWAIELPMLYLLGALSLVLFGPGRLAIRQDQGLLD